MFWLTDDPLNFIQYILTLLIQMMTLLSVYAFVLTSNKQNETKQCEIDDEIDKDNRFHTFSSFYFSLSYSPLVRRVGSHFE